MTNPLVSIIIPIYNGEMYMKDAIDSALAQSYKNCEIIVVNDGSTDKTEEIAMKYGSRIRYFYKENGGVSTALNMGIENMKGEYFSWLSHDDVYFPDKVEKQINALCESGDMKRIVWGDIISVDEEKKEHRSLNFGKSEEDSSLTKGRFPVIKGFLAGCSLLIHRSHFARAGRFNPDLRYVQDYDLWFRMFKGQTTVYISSPLYKQRVHCGMGTRVFRNEIVNEESSLWIRIAKEIDAEEAISLFGSQYAFYYYMYFFMKGKFGKHRAVAELLDVFMSALTQVEADRYVNPIKNFLRSFSPEKRISLCIFCAGVYGKRLFHELEFLRIKVDFFADNDDEKSGKCIVEDVNCISFQELEMKKDETLVIVANRYPESVAGQLRSAGFPMVTTKQVLDQVIAYNLSNSI